MKSVLLLFAVLILSSNSLAQQDETDRMLFLALLSARERTLFTYKLNDRSLESSMFKELNENDTLYYKNGQVLRISRVQNEKLEGVLAYYFPNGRIAVEFPYQLNTLVDTVKSYYPNGRIEHLCPVRKGKIEKEIHYSESGQRIGEEQARKGSRKNTYMDYLGFEFK